MKVSAEILRVAAKKGLISGAGAPLKTPRKRSPSAATDSPAKWAILLYPACRVISESNARAERWRVKAQRSAVRNAWWWAPVRNGPTSWAHVAKVRVTLTHLGPRMDSDNLAGAFKAVRDEIAANAGVDDGSDWYEWVYEQRTGKPLGIEIRIECRT